MKTSAVTQLLVGLTVLSLMPATQALPPWLSNSLKRNPRPVVAADTAVYSPPLAPPGGYGAPKNGGDGPHATSISSATITLPSTASGDPKFLVNGLGIDGSTTISEFLISSTATSADVDSTTTIFVTFTSTITRTTTPGVYPSSTSSVIPASSAISSSSQPASDQTFSVDSTRAIVSFSPDSTTITTADGTAGTSVANATSFQPISSLTQISPEGSSTDVSSAVLSSSTKSSVGSIVLDETFSTDSTRAIISFSPDSTTITTADGTAVTTLVNTTYSQPLSSLTRVLSEANSTAKRSMTSLVLSSSVPTVMPSDTRAFSNSSLPSHGTRFSASSATYTASGNVSAGNTYSQSYATGFSSSVTTQTGSGNTSAGHSSLPSYATGLSSSAPVQTGSGNVSAELNSSIVSTASSGPYFPLPSNSTSVYDVTTTSSSSSLSINASSLAVTSSTTHSTVHSSFSTGIEGPGLPASSSGLYVNTTTAASITSLLPVTTSRSTAVSILKSSFTAQSAADGFSTSLVLLQGTSGTESAGSSSPANFTGLSIIYTPTGSATSGTSPIITIGTSASGLPTDKPSLLTTSIGPIVPFSSSAIDDKSPLSTISSIILTSSPAVDNASPPASIGPIIPASSSGIDNLLPSSSIILRSSTAGTPPFSNSTSVPTFRPSTTMSVRNSTSKGDGISNSTGINNSSSTRVGTTSVLSFIIPTLSSTSKLSSTTIIATPTPYYRPHHGGYRKHRPHHYYDYDDYEDYEEYEEYEQLRGV